MRAIVIALVSITFVPALAQEGPAGRAGASTGTDHLSVPQGQQQSTEQQPQRNETTQQTPSTDSNATRNRVTIVDPREAPHQSGSPKQRAEDGEGKNPNHGATGPSWQRFVEKLFDDPVAFFTVWVAVFTAALAISTIGLWRQTRRLAVQAVEASKDTKSLISISGDALKISRISSDAAVGSVQVARESLSAEMRSWLDINLKQFNIRNGATPESAKDAVCNIKCIVGNTGRTPALKVRIDTRLIIGPGEIALVDKTTQKLAADFRSRALGLEHIVFPGGQVQIFSNTPEPFTRREIIDFASSTQGGAFIYLVICLTYSQTIEEKTSQSMLVYILGEEQGGNLSPVDFQDEKWMLKQYSLTPVLASAT